MDKRLNQVGIVVGLQRKLSSASDLVVVAAVRSYASGC